MTRETAQHEPPLVIVTGADTPTGLTTARALRGMPLRIWGVTTRPESSCCASNIWTRLIVVSGDADRQIDRILEAVDDETAKPILLLAQDDLVEAASRRRDELMPRCHLPLPSAPATELMLDKTRFQHWAEAEGFPVPYATVVATTEEFDAALAAVPLPAIVKPLVRTPAWDRRMGSRKCLWVGENGRLKEGRWSAEALFELSPRYLVQSWIEGGDEDVYFYLAAVSPEGAVLDEVCGRKLMQWPPLTGSTAVCHTIEDAGMLADSRRILLAAGLRGLGSIEYKRNRRDGRLYITEPTVGRNDHQSAVAVAGGHNPTQALVQHILGERASKGEAGRTPSPLWIDELATIRHCRSERTWGRLVRFVLASLRRGLPRPLLLERGDSGPFRRMAADIRRRRMHS